MKKTIFLILKILFTMIILIFGGFFIFISTIIIDYSNFDNAFSDFIILSLPIFIITLIWKFSVNKCKVYFSLIIPMFILSLIISGIKYYDQSLIINTSPNIYTEEYLPFNNDSKIVKLNSETLKLKENLPILDGAAAVFPIYSAFVNAVYPENTKLNDGVFEYNNTSHGYKLLAEKKTDIFFGAYPSEKQIEYAKSLGTEFEFTPIGYEAFVFFVHKNNPINNLSTTEIQNIYSGEIKNWKEVGGKNKKIVAYQRNEGSGSQSMLIRFMNGKKIMRAPTTQTNDMMVGIIENVANYKSEPTSIGFSFRYYVEGIIKNPNIKLLSIDGVAPTIENIKSNKYSITTPLYAVTYKNNENENVKKLIDWILSEEGQYIIEQTGYVPIK